MSKAYIATVDGNCTAEPLGTTGTDNSSDTVRELEAVLRTLSNISLNQAEMTRAINFKLQEIHKLMFEQAQQLAVSMFIVNSALQQMSVGAGQAPVPVFFSQPNHAAATAAAAVAVAAADAARQQYTQSVFAAQPRALPAPPGLGQPVFGGRPVQWSGATFQPTGGMPFTFAATQPHPPAGEPAACTVGGGGGFSFGTRKQ